jgi:hypothetical protein
MTVLIKMKDELEAFNIAGDLGDFSKELNIAAASGKQFVVVPNAQNKPRMIAVHNISWADEVDDDTGAIW